MASMSDYLENKLIDQLFRGVAYTFPTSLYAALFTVTPTDSTAGTEVTGGSYARVAIACNSTNFSNTQNSGTGVSTGSTGTTTNLTAITWATAPTANWGSVVGCALMDASTAGNVMAFCVLGTAKTINNGDPAPSFAAGALTFQIDN